MREWPETPEAQLATKKVPAKKAAAKKRAAAKKTSASPSGGLALEHVGSSAGEIPVRISYRIIELFSAGLYSSPNKALEELVTNSYDAWSDHVDLLLPANLRASDATIWVVDNGESMDLAGLIDLWQIAKSTKRTRPLRAGRKPVGKFGIGKLATYVLASKLTYLCRRDGQVLAVTMDFGQVDQSADQDDTIVTLAVRSLDDDELHEALLPMRQLPGGAEVADRIEAGEWETWTAAALSSLKPAAHELVAGMVRWILSTALPMSPAFSLTMNGKDVKSSVEKAKILKRWDVGKEKKDLPSGVDATQDDDGRVCVEIEGLGNIYGRVEIYKDLLTKGKASELGHSHGFFVRVLGRLLNLDDPLFGMPALSHSSFNRFRMEIDADGLDDFLTSTRESVQETAAVKKLREYLHVEFNRARQIYEKWLASEEPDGGGVAARIDTTAASLSRRPLVTAVARLLEGDIDQLLLVERPDIDKDAAAALVTELEYTLETDEGPIDEVTLGNLGVDGLVASFDPLTKTVTVNTFHPFFSNFISDVARKEPFEMIAVAEILTEAYLHDEGLAPDVVRRIVRRRDGFLRELVSQHRLGPAVIAQNLRDQAGNEKGLEEACHETFRALGFEVTPLGGNGKPEGVGKATLGVNAEGERDDYSFTYDAKSTGHAAVKAKTVGISTLARHRDDVAKADHAIVVAPDFEGGSKETSAIVIESRKHNVTPIRVRDLAALVEIAAARMVGLRRLRGLFKCRTADESAAWVKELIEEDEPKSPPLREVLDAMTDLQAESDDPVEVAALIVKLRDTYKIPLKKEELEEAILVLKTMAPTFVTYRPPVVILETTKDKVLEVMARHYQELPKELRLSTVAEWLAPKPPPRKRIVRKPSKT